MLHLLHGVKAHVFRFDFSDKMIFIRNFICGVIVWRTIFCDTTIVNFCI